MTALQEENQRLKEEIHLSQGQLQGGREGLPISVEEFVKEQRKHEEVVRTLRNMEEKLEEIILQKIVRCNLYAFVLSLEVCVSLIDVHVHCILVTCSEAGVHYYTVY